MMQLSVSFYCWTTLGRAQRPEGVSDPIKNQQAGSVRNRNKKKHLEEENKEEKRERNKAGLENFRAQNEMYEWCSLNMKVSDLFFLEIKIIYILKTTV